MLLELVVQVIDRARRAGAVFTETEMIDLSYAKNLRQQAYEEGLRKGLETGIEEGEAQGALEVLSALAQTRLARTLTAGESVALRVQLVDAGVREVTRRVLAMTAAELEAWLAG